MKVRPRFWIISIIAIIVLAGCFVLAVQPSARASLTQTGPVDPYTGFPFWYQYGQDNPETGDKKMRLELCVAGPECFANLPDPAKRANVPDNFPEEAFYFSSNAIINNVRAAGSPSSGRATLTMATEAAFLNGPPTLKQQITFNRLRVVVSGGLVPGKEYTFTHPYGVEKFTADSNGSIKPNMATEDTGCVATPCNFSNIPAPGGRIGPWITWDTFGNPDPALAPPAGYIGDGATPHRIKGTATDFFQIEGEGFSEPVTTNLFVVSGKLAVQKVVVTPYTGLYNTGPKVSIVASDYNLTTYYTLDGSDPLDALNPERKTYSIPVEIPFVQKQKVDTTLRFGVVDSAGNTVQTGTEVYTIDNLPPVITATPNGNDWNSKGPLKVTLTSNDPEATIYYTTDGTNPVITGPGASQNCTPCSIDFKWHGTYNVRFVGVDKAGNVSQVGNETYDVTIEQFILGKNVKSNSYPLWFEDKTGLRLGQCLDLSRGCLTGLPDPNKAPSITDAATSNFPDEWFYYNARAEMDAGNGGRARLVLATEGAFSSADGMPAAGQQILFNRIRVVIKGVAPGEKYTVTHPYGVENFVADARGQIAYTEDLGCMAGPCGNFEQASVGRLGPWLKWDNSEPQAPQGTVGDGITPHKVAGSPHGNNFFRVEGKNAGGNGVDKIETDLFVVIGLDYQLEAKAYPSGGVFNSNQSITLQANDPDATVYYTDNGEDPKGGMAKTFDPNNPVSIEGNTSRANTVTLKFAAKDLRGQWSEVRTETYTINAQKLTASVTPAGKVYNAPVNVVLATPNEGTTIYYTLNGSDPANPSNSARKVYSNPIAIDRISEGANAGMTMLKFMVQDLSGNRSDTYNETYLIASGANANSPVNGATGFPVSYTDKTGLKLGLCTQSGPCFGPSPDPTRTPSVPANFASETFYFAANAALTTPGGGRGLLVLATEAAFAPPAVPAAGQQITFNRIRAKITGLKPNTVYRLKHPYGEMQVQTDAKGILNYNQDIGCGGPPCNFGQLWDSSIKSWLRWDPNVAPAAPAGFIGDGATPHKVVGSPTGNNFFLLEERVAGGAFNEVARTDEFVIQGQLAKLETYASPLGGVSSSTGPVALVATEPEAKIYYSLNGSNPDIEYSDTTRITLPANATTTLKYRAVLGSVSTPVYKEVYTVDSVAPVVSVTPDSGLLPAGQKVTVSSSKPGKIFYTTDASNPTLGTNAARKEYTAPLSPPATTTYNFAAQDLAGNWSEVVTKTYTIPAAEDRTAPVARAAVVNWTPTFTRTTLSSGGVPVRVSWPAATDNVKVTGYALQMQTNTAAFANVPLAAVTATEATVNLTPGSTYTFRLQASDAAGNISEWVNSAPYTLTVDQETVKAVKTSGKWTAGAVTQALGNNVLSSSVAGTRLTYSFTGTKTAWIAAKGPDRGRAEVWLDGVRVATVDLYAAGTAQGSFVAFNREGLTNANHTIEIRVLGTRNTASTGTRVDVDAFLR